MCLCITGLVTSSWTAAAQHSSTKHSTGETRSCSSRASKHDASKSTPHDAQSFVMETSPGLGSACQSVVKLSSPVFECWSYIVYGSRSRGTNGDGGALWVQPHALSKAVSTIEWVRVLGMASSFGLKQKLNFETCQRNNSQDNNERTHRRV